MSTPKDPLDLMTPEQREWFNKHVSIQTPEQQARPIKFARADEEAPQRVELTEAERDQLATWWDDNNLNSSMNALCREVAAIVAAREADAEQAGREDNALHDMCYVSGSKALEAREAAARREALLEAADDLEPLVDAQHPASLNPDQWLRDRAETLAEPERDEEGGR